MISEILSMSIETMKVFLNGEFFTFKVWRVNFNNINKSLNHTD